MRFLFYLFLLLALFDTAPAQVQYRFDIEAEPVCQVYLESSGKSQYLGHSDQPVYINSRFLEGRGSFDLTLRADGYIPRHVNVKTFSLKAKNDLPVEGSYNLQPRSNIITLRDHLGAIGGAGIALLVGSFFFYQKRQRLGSQLERADLLERIAVNAGDDPRVGAKIGDWRILEKIGQGGMSTVYRAVPDDTLSDQHSVAVKLLETLNTKDEDQAVGRARRELSLGASLNHPNIIHTVDHGCDKGQHYLVMEWLDGGPLSRRIPREGLPLGAFFKIALPLLDAMIYAHELGVVHRDLKPDNIFITQKGPVILDFGLARSHQHSELTKTGTCMGTPDYMAPEQITGSTFHPSLDQYSLGIIFYQLLVGEVPFKGDDAMQILFSHVSKTPPPLREQREEIPLALEQTILKMLAKTGSARFDSLREVRQKMVQLQTLEVSV